MAKKSLYAPEDVARWDEVFLELLGMEVARLRGEPGYPKIEWAQVYGFMGEAQFQALTEVAKGNCPRALGWLVISVELACRMHEDCYSGRGGMNEVMLTAGYWRELLYAHASTSKEMVERFCRLYNPNVHGTRDSIYHGRILKALTDKRIQDALAILSEKRPSVERMFQGYIECFEAIARQDEAGFRQAIATASGLWEKYAWRMEKGLPPAVCFLDGAGIIRVAEHVWGRRVAIEDPNIPAGLLGDAKPERIDLGI